MRCIINPAESLDLATLGACLHFRISHFQKERQCQSRKPRQASQCPLSREPDHRISSGPFHDSLRLVESQHGKQHHVHVPPPHYLHVEPSVTISITAILFDIIYFASLAKYLVRKKKIRKGYFSCHDCIHHLQWLWGSGMIWRVC